MSYNLFIDDERDPYKVTWVQLPLGPWVIVRSYNEFVKMIEERGLPEFITFDHDLADEHYPFNQPNGWATSGKDIPYHEFKEKTGLACAQWLVDYCLDKNAKLPKFDVHSKNTVGKENIRNLLHGFKQFQDRQ